MPTCAGDCSCKCRRVCLHPGASVPASMSGCPRSTSNCAITTIGWIRGIHELQTCVALCHCVGATSHIGCVTRPRVDVRQCVWTPRGGKLHLLLVTAKVSCPIFLFMVWPVWPYSNMFFFCISKFLDPIQPFKW